jgi:signal-transduction protein with cAMP-binding, CBS, and nucleotidyltransferase domain
VKILSPKYIRLKEEFKIPVESINMFERRCKMILGNIIKSKPLIIVTVHKDQKISDAVKVMGEKNVSGVFVVDADEKLVGLFTERDIVHCVVKGVSLADEVIGNIMRTDLTTFDPSIEISSAIAIASKKNIRHLPVVEGDRIVGMITFRDLVSYLLPEICYMAKEVY